MRPAPATILALGLCLVTFPAAAQQQQQRRGGPIASVRPAAEPHALGEYAGVTPGTGNLPPRAPGAAEGSVLITWPGFQARPDGASRFFVQTNGPVTTETVNEEGRVVILVRNVRIHLRNNRRWLETRYFNTPVRRSRVERRRGDVAIVLQMRAQVTPRVSTQAGEGGYHFILIEFPPGEYVPAELRPPEPAPPPQQQQQAPPANMPSQQEQRQMDQEQPPSFGGSGTATGNINVGFGN